MVRSSLLLTIAAVAALTLSPTTVSAVGCLGDDAELVLGVLHPASGKNTVKAGWYLPTVEHVVEKINENGGVTCDGTDYPIRVVFEDDGSSPDVAGEATRSLVNAGAHVVIGTYASSVSKGASLVAAELGRVLIGVLASSGGIFGADNGAPLSYTVSSPPSYKDSLRAVAHAGATSVCLLHTTDTPMDHLFDPLDEAADELGLRHNSHTFVDGAHEHGSADTGDYASIKAAITECASGAYDVLFAVGTHTPVDMYRTACEEIGWVPKIMVFPESNIGDRTVVARSGAAVLDALSSAKWTPAMPAVPYSDGILGTAAEFASSLAASMDMAVDDLNSNVASAAYAVLAATAAIEAAGVANPATELTQQMIGDALSTLSVYSPVGKISFDAASGYGELARLVVQHQIEGTYTVYPLDAADRDVHYPSSLYSAYRDGVVAAGAMCDTERESGNTQSLARVEGLATAATILAGIACLLALMILVRKSSGPSTTAVKVKSAGCLKPETEAYVVGLDDNGDSKA